MDRTPLMQPGKVKNLARSHKSRDVCEHQSNYRPGIYKTEFELLRNIWLSVNFILVLCFILLRLWILFSTISGVSLLYDGLAVVDAALMNENKRAIKVIIFIYLSRFGCDLHKRIHRFL